MVREIKTISDAAHEWVREMNAFPCDMIAKLWQCNSDDWREITPPSVGDRVYVYPPIEGCTTPDGEIENLLVDAKTDDYLILMDDYTSVRLSEDDFEVQRETCLPMWGTVWQFDNDFDNQWLEGQLREMADCGFRVYKSNEFGYFFGIDGAGYDFYEEHWIPLYKARGLRWHDIEG